VFVFLNTLTMNFNVQFRLSLLGLYYYATRSCNVQKMENKVQSEKKLKFKKRLIKV